ncbi:MAG: carboxypeptidase-like regulatory domain-containing protein [Acidobacteriaceae bacterium]
MKHTKLYLSLFLSLAFIVLWGTRAEGQAVTATLVGTITDQSSAVVANSPITITNEGTGISHSAATNASGNYEFSLLQPGVYSVSVSAPGFKHLDRRGVEVQLNTTTRLDLVLQAGASSQTITVSGQVPLLQTDRADVSAQIESHQMRDLPMGAQRNFQSLEALVPGVNNPNPDHSTFFNAQQSYSFQVNGQSELSNNLQIEGIDDNERTGLLQVYIPPAAAIQTVNVETSNYAPEFGRSAGAVTNVILKSGTNQFHGSAYEFNQVSALAARSYFNNSGAFPRSTINYYGATLGGPIVRDHTFFFGDFLRTSNHQGQFQLLSVPTADFRNGNLSGGPTAVYDPQTGNPDGTGRQQFDYQGNLNTIDPARINPISTKLMALVPLPNVPGAGFTNNYQKNTVFNVDANTYDIKADQRVGKNDILTGRFSWQRTTTFQQPVFGDAGGPAAGAFEGTGINTTYNTAGEYTHVLSPTLFTEIRAGVDHYRNTAQQADYGTDASTAIGVPGVNISPFNSGLVGIDIAGFSSPIVGYSASIPWVRAESNIDFTNNWTKILGNHSIKLGFELRRVRDNLTQGQTFSPRGVYRYRDGQTGLNAPGNKTSFANDFASFLLDIPDQVGRDAPVTSASWRQTLYFSFVQDTWQATKSLTLTYGVRWELYPAATPDRKGGFSQYDTNTNTLHVSGYGDVPDNIGMNTNWNDFEPRLGFAYRALPKTVIRGGFGISHTPFQDNNYAYNFPVRGNNAYNSLSSYTPALLPDGSTATLAAGFPPLVAPAIPADGILPAPINQNYTSVNVHYHDPYVESYNLSIERQIGAWTATVSYVGNVGRHIPINYNLNAGLVAGAGVHGEPYFQKFGTTATIELLPAGRNTNYNSLQARVNRRFHNGLAITSAFAWQKSMGYNSSTTGLAGLSFYLDPPRDYSVLAFSPAVTSVSSFIYELPFGQEKPFLNRGLMAKVVGGWQVSGIVSFFRGTPLFFTASSSQLNAPGTSQVPNEVAPFRKLKGVGTKSPWFDTSAFEQPVGPALGNMGKSAYSGPGSANLNASASRTFPITERLRFQFRIDATNALNHPVFSNPDTTLTDANFGKVTGTGGSGGRTLQLSGNLTF